MKEMLYMMKKYPIRGALILIALVCAVLLNLFPVLLADYSVKTAPMESMISSTVDIDDGEVPMGNLINYYGDEKE